MKTLFASIAAAGLALAVRAAETNELEEADSGGLSVEVSVDVLSDYVWRGKICNGNPVWQPSATLAYAYGDFGKVSANVWASMDLTHRRGTMNASRRASGIQELDYTLAYANSFGPLDVEIGHIWYSFPYGNGRPTEELYGTVAYNNPIATPSLTVYWDYLDTGGNDASAVYATFALSRDFELVEKLTVTPSAAIFIAYSSHSSKATFCSFPITIFFFSPSVMLSSPQEKQKPLKRRAKSSLSRQAQARASTFSPKTK